MTRLLGRDEITGGNEILGNFIIFCIKHAKKTPDWEEFGDLLLEKLRPSYLNEPPASAHMPTPTATILLHAAATRIAMQGNQSVGEKSNYYITLEQLEELLRVDPTDGALKRG